MELVTALPHRRAKNLDGQRGQAIIFLAIAVVVLLGIAGLAIDGGTTMYQRRLQQNGADAAALAGALQLKTSAQVRITVINFLPFDGVWTNLTDGQVQNTIVQYIGLNSQSSSNYDPANYPAWYVDSSGANKAKVGGGTIPPEARGVRVTSINQHVQVSFLGLLGFSQVKVPALATDIISTTSFTQGGLGGAAPIVVDLATYKSLTSEGFGPASQSTLTSVFGGASATQFTWSDLINICCGNNTTKNCLSTLISPGVTCSPAGNVVPQSSCTPTCPPGYSSTVNQPPGNRTSACFTMQGLVGYTIALPIITGPIAQNTSSQVVTFGFLHVTQVDCGGQTETIHGYWVDPATTHGLPGTTPIPTQTLAGPLSLQGFE